MIIILIGALSIAVFVYCIAEELLVSRGSNRLNIEKQLDKMSTIDKKRARELERAKRKSWLSRVNFSDKYKESLKLAQINAKPEEYAMIWVCVALLPATFSVAMFGFNAIRVVFLILVSAIAPYIYLNMQIKKQRDIFEQQLGDGLMVLANALRAGFSFQQAMGSVSSNMADPIGREFAAVSRELQLGEGVEESMGKVVERMQSGDLRLLSTAVVVQQQVGGNLTEILETISQTIRDRLTIKRTIKALTAQGKLSGYMIGALPVLLLVAISILNPEYVEPLFNTLIGHIMLAVGVIMIGIGFFIISRIIDIKL